MKTPAAVANVWYTADGSLPARFPSRNSGIVLIGTRSSLTLIKEEVLDRFLGRESAQRNIETVHIAEIPTPSDPTTNQRRTAVKACRRMLRRIRRCAEKGEAETDYVVVDTCMPRGVVITTLVQEFLRSYVRVSRTDLKQWAMPHGSVCLPSDLMALPDMSLSVAIDVAFGTSLEADSRRRRDEILQSIKSELGLYPELKSEPFDDVMDEQELRAKVENHQMARSFVSLLIEFLSSRRDDLRGLGFYSQIRCVAVYDPSDFDPEWIRSGSTGIEEYSNWFDREVLDVYEWVSFEICGVEDAMLYVRNTLAVNHDGPVTIPSDQRTSVFFNDAAFPGNQIGKSGDELLHAQESWSKSGSGWLMAQRFGRPGPERVRQYPDPEKIKELHPQPVSVETVGDGDDESTGTLEEIVDIDSATDSVEKLETVAYEELPELNGASEQDEDE